MSFWLAYWWHPWGWALIMSVPFVAICIGEYAHWSLAPLTAIVLYSAIAYFNFIDYDPSSKQSTTMSDLTHVYDMSAGKLSAISVLTFLLVVLFFARISPIIRRWWLAVPALLSVIPTLLQYRDAPWSRGGVLGNASMNGCLIACLLPFVFELHWSLAIPCLVAITMTKASVPIGVALVVLLAYRPRLSTLIPAILCLSGAYLWQGAELFASNGRSNIWAMILPYLTPWGIGLGVSPVFIPWAQIQTGTDQTQLFMWLHNDWLQILLELGIPGLFSALLVFGAAIWGSRHDRALCASLLGFGAFGCFNYPLHLAPTCATLACVLALALKPAPNP